MFFNDLVLQLRKKKEIWSSQLVQSHEDKKTHKTICPQTYTIHKASAQLLSWLTLFPCDLPTESNIFLHLHRGKTWLNLENSGSPSILLTRCSLGWISWLNYSKLSVITCTYSSGCVKMHLWLISCCIETLPLDTKQVFCSQELKFSALGVVHPPVAVQKPLQFCISTYLLIYDTVLKQLINFPRTHTCTSNTKGSQQATYKWYIILYILYLWICIST